jgi:hypothetical protein
MNVVETHTMETTPPENGDGGSLDPRDLEYSLTMTNFTLLSFCQAVGFVGYEIGSQGPSESLPFLLIA